MSYLLSNSKLEMRLNNKKTAKTVRLMKKPVDESLYDEFSINKIFGLPLRNKIYESFTPGSKFSGEK